MILATMIQAATTVALAAGTMLALAVTMGWILGWANRAFHVETDPKVDAINDALPGANCGGCGYVGCNEYAEALAADPGKVPPTLCSPGGAPCAQAIAGILGIDVEESYPYRPVVHCAANSEDRLQQREYRGEPTCGAANMVAGIQGCTYGCLGLGDCVRSCNFDAIHVIDGLATVDYEKCTGCGACERACPRHIISMVPFKAEQMLVVACSNKDGGKQVREVCTVGCIGCKACQKKCDLFEIKDNLASLDYDKYAPGVDFSEALEKCPREGLVWVGTPSEKDKRKVADEALPEVVEPDFHSTVDDAEYRG